MDHRVHDRLHPLALAGSGPPTPRATAHAHAPRVVGASRAGGRDSRPGRLSSVRAEEKRQRVEPIPGRRGARGDHTARHRLCPRDQRLRARRRLHRIHRRLRGRPSGQPAGTWMAAVLACGDAQCSATERRFLGSAEPIRPGTRHVRRAAAAGARDHHHRRAPPPANHAQGEHRHEPYTTCSTCGDGASGRVPSALARPVDRLRLPTRQDTLVSRSQAEPRSPSPGEAAGPSH